MSSPKKRVLIVDDSANDIRFLMENLKDTYAVLAATSGVKALEIAAKDEQPDVILLDVSMPEMDGYETCIKLKQNPATENIDVIFVTANDTIEEKLKGYEVGGSDYLIKPVMPEELKQKVNLILSNQEKSRQSNQEAQTAAEVAMTAMMDAGEQSIVMEFMRNSFDTDSIEALARLLVDSTAKYELNNSVQIRTPWQAINVGTTEPIPPLEEELMFRLKDSGRIKGLGKRLILNFDNITLLIKNLPDDEHKSGRLRDHLALLMEGAVARYKALSIERELEDLMTDSMDALHKIQAMQQQQKQQYVSIMDNVKADVQESFMSYGLTEDQEAVLINIVEKGEEESLKTFEQGLIIDDQVQLIIDRLKSFLKHSD